MPAPHPKFLPVPDATAPLPADAPPQGRHRRRTLRPVALVTAAIVATALGTTVGALAYGSGRTEQAVFSASAMAPDATASAAPGAPTDAAGTQSADPVPATPGSGAPTPVPNAPTGPPTDTGAVGGPRSATPPHAAASPVTGDAATEAAVLALVNQERAKAGCRALTVDPRLAATARAHSADMASRRYFAHDTPDGVGVGTRVTRAGYKWSLVGENIAEGQPTAAAVMKAWMKSPGHRANILNCRFTNIGIGLAHQGRTPLWTQDFGRPM